MLNTQNITSTSNPDIATFDKLFQLVKTNMSIYQPDFNDSNKIAEMKEGSPNFDIMYINNTIAAFSYYQFTVENDIDVIYLYELQVEHKFQNQKLASILMDKLELLATSFHLPIMMTVFKENEGAIRFYKKRGYINDSSCPSVYFKDSRRNKYNYIILIKIF